jgi:hypothetical protein
MNWFKAILLHITSNGHYSPVPMKSFYNQYGNDDQIKQAAKEVKKRSRVHSSLCVETVVNKKRKLIKFDYWSLRDKIFHVPNRLKDLQEDF